MTITFSAGEPPPVDRLAEAETYFETTVGELLAAINKIRSGTIEDAKQAGQAAKDLRTALEIAYNERGRVEKLRKQVAGAVGTGTLDLHAARDEIGRRLARLRNAGAGG